MNIVVTNVSTMLTDLSYWTSWGFPSLSNNTVELSVLNRQCLKRHIPDQDTFKREIAAWEEERNQKSDSLNWRFITEDARIKLKRLYPLIQT